MTTHPTTKADAASVVKIARAAFASNRTRFIVFRKKQLNALKLLLEENKGRFYDAMHKDFRKPKMEAYCFEIESVIGEIKFLIDNLTRWILPQLPTDKMVMNYFDKVQIYNEPYGVALVMSSWNYPVRISLLPFAGAIAAGNTVILKPSEVAIHTALLIAELVPNYLDKACYHVFMGGVGETTGLLKEKFDYVFFTGSTFVGRLVHEACAKHLTPATLELGGKSPAYIDPSADIEMATRRILWGKLVNCGQSCIAPDYVLCNKKVEQEFLKHAQVIIEEFYDGNPKTSPDYARIINEKHMIRLQTLLVGMDIPIGGKTDMVDKYIEPTILINVRRMDPVMQEEIFGPILPILNVERPSEVIDIINEGDKPLALYIFSKDLDVSENIIKNTSSGGVTINDIFAHMGCDSLPFGGVGSSGMGAYHGEYTFATFSHKKGVLTADFKGWKEKRLYSSRYPPATEKKIERFLFFTKKRKVPKMTYLPHLAAFLAGMFVVFVWKIGYK